jgi:hypothetical protein
MNQAQLKKRMGVNEVEEKNMLEVYEYVKKETDGKLSEGVYIQVFNDFDEMLFDMEWTEEYVKNNMGFIHQELPKDGPFILRDYQQAEFVFLDSTDSAKVSEFIDYLLAK